MGLFGLSSNINSCSSLTQVSIHLLSLPMSLARPGKRNQATIARTKIKQMAIYGDKSKYRGLKNPQQNSQALEQSLTPEEPTPKRIKYNKPIETKETGNHFWEYDFSLEYLLGPQPPTTLEPQIKLEKHTRSSSDTPDKIQTKELVCKFL